MSDARRGMAVALDQLSRRDRSEEELRRRLLAKEISPEEIDAVIVRLKELNYLDDRRLARHLATAAVANGKGYGIRLAMDLSRRRIPRQIVDETMAGISADYDQGELVRELLCRKFPAFDPAAADNREKGRVMNFLLRRGFSRSAVFDAMRHLSTDFTD
jgi:regulatory protein